MICKDCEYARKTRVKGKVGCYLISKAKHFGSFPGVAKCPHCGEALGSEWADFDSFVDTIKFNRDVTYLGWVNLGLRPDSKSTEGMITSECHVLDEDNGCNYFEYRRR